MVKQNYWNQKNPYTDGKEYDIYDFLFVILTCSFYYNHKNNKPCGYKDIKDSNSYYSISAQHICGFRSTINMHFQGNINDIFYLLCGRGLRYH